MRSITTSVDDTRQRQRCARSTNDASKATSENEFGSAVQVNVMRAGHVHVIGADRFEMPMTYGAFDK